MRIQLLCDQKWRDLPNLAAIKLLLERLGHRVLLNATKDAVPMIRAFRPDCVVFNHLRGERHRAIARALRQSGVAVVWLPTEGTTHPSVLSLAASHNTDLRVGDLFLLWNEPVANLVRARWQFEQAITPVIGCTRFDFYHARFAAAVTPRELFCQTYGFDSRRPIVTWATKYVQAHLEQPSPDREKLLREVEDFGAKPYYDWRGIDVTAMPGVHARNRQAAAEAFLQLAAALPDCQFLIKPHPAEDQTFYRDLIVTGGRKNIRFCPQDYIWNVLNASAVHLHRHCTTAVEAWMWGKPTIELATDQGAEAKWPEREAGSEVVETAQALIAAVGAYLNGGTITRECEDHRRAYIRTWFGPTDGRRCICAATAIDDFLKTRGRRRPSGAPIGHLPGSLRDVAAAVTRYALGLRPNQPLVRKRPTIIDPTDKQVTRPEMRAYAKLVAPAFN